MYRLAKNFEILWLFEKVFFAKFGDIVSVGGPSEQSTKGFLQKSYFLPICESFVLYGVTLNVLLSVKYLFVLACSMLQQNY